jgi:hypothetical protein
MATIVTVNGGEVGTVSVPFTTLANAQAAQAAANVVSQLVVAGTLSQVLLPPGSPVPPSLSTFGGVVETISGGTGGTTATLPANYLALSETLPAGSAPATFQTTNGSANPTVIAAGGLNFINNSFNAQVFFGGGDNVFIQNGAYSATVNVDGNANIQGTGGTLLVNAFDGSVVDITGGGADTVNVIGPSDVIYLSGSSTVPVIVNATGSGDFGTFVVENGGAGFINPGAADVTVVSGAQTPSGSVTVFGANSLTGGSSALTVFNANGYFVGGSGGDNILVTSRVAGATTLVGSTTATDTLFGLASGDTLRAGDHATDFMATFASGDTLIAGAGVTTMFGANTGGNTFEFTGPGAASAFGAYGDATVAANNYIDNLTNPTQGGPGANITINDFRSGTDTFTILDGATVLTPLPTTLSDAGGTPHSTVQLSDGTTITFNYTTVKSTDFLT